MTTKEEFCKNFTPHESPLELMKLLDFQEQVSSFEDYSSGFGLLSNRKGDLTSWSENSEFLSKILPFAQANGSGSFYALWNNGTSLQSSSFPVVVFGDEGGVHIVAENVRGLLQILAFDTEAMIDFDEVTYYKDEDEYEPSEGHGDYVAWLRNEIGLQPVEPSLVVAAAQAKLKVAFDTWFKK